MSKTRQIFSSEVSRFAALTLTIGTLAGCGASLPSGGNSGIGADALPKLSISDTDNNVIVGPPRKIYERIARQSNRCWFGPFGSVHDSYMMHAEVPPPSSSAPVTMAIHRRLSGRKKPWGPKLLRVTFTGRSSTTLGFQNVGMRRDVMEKMTIAFTRWANGRTDCPALLKADPAWAAAPVARRSTEEQRSR